MIKIYIDGACSGNPGIGGWGVVILKNNNDPIFLQGGRNQTTNNRMELTAAIKALQHFENSEELTVVTDSKYVKDGIESWIIKWKNNNWKTSSDKILKHALETIDDAIEIEGNYAETWHLKGIILHEMGEDWLANKCFRIANEQDPSLRKYLSE